MQANELTACILAAKNDSSLADDLIRQYLPFIKAKVSELRKRPPHDGEDDELSIAMFAFYEAIMSYEPSRGAFLPYASLAIRHRLIDYYRRESRNEGLVSLNTPTEADGSQTLEDTLRSGTDIEQEISEHEAARDEIAHYAEDLKTFGLSLSDIADNCPKQERTLRICRQALNYARANPGILREFEATKKLPLAKLSHGSPILRKKLERHRKYMISLLLAYTNGFEIIRGHLQQMAPQKGDDECDT